MTKLNLSPNLENPDDFYAALLAAHDGLTLEETSAFNARLILVLANHVGDQNILEQSIKIASQTG
ncbi:DUF2783 domain-containing protein [Rhodobacteraceae bacterium S2214]|nr:DUF2783 domain-containing protein [Rhodobacteraceae bacterium S2214]